MSSLPLLGARYPMKTKRTQPTYFPRTTTCHATRVPYASTLSSRRHRRPPFLHLFLNTLRTPRLRRNTINTMVIRLPIFRPLTTTRLVASNRRHHGTPLTSNVRPHRGTPPIRMKRHTRVLPHNLTSTHNSRQYILLPIRRHKAKTKLLTTTHHRGLNRGLHNVKPGQL